jgi:hypothetical protein
MACNLLLPVAKVRIAGEKQQSPNSRAEILKPSIRATRFMDKNNQAQTSNTEKNPDEWTTGEETMTGAQRSYLKTLCDEAGEEFDDSLTKAEASKKIDELQQKTGRGIEH